MITDLDKVFTIEKGVVMDKICIKIPSDKKYISTLRLSLSSIANVIEMDIENIEDLKVSISETMNLFIDECESIEINIEVFEEKLEVEVNPKIVIEKLLKKRRE